MPLQQFAQVPGVKLTGMAGTHREAARAAARRFGIPDIEDVDKLLARDDVDLVYIATPPFLHYPQAMAALEAGKHVICEKPLAMTVEQADAMIATARKHDRLLVANLMQRYNPLYDAVEPPDPIAGAGRPAPRLLSRTTPRTRTCRRSTGSGTDRRAAGSSSSTACTSSTCSPAGWAPARSWRPSVGIRPGSSPPIEEHVQCTVRYGPTVLVNFYHGFHQTGRMDRQELRLVFERGDVTLYRLGADPRPHPRDRRRGRDPRLVRPLPRRAARCLGDLCAARTEPARAATRRSTSTR